MSHVGIDKSGGDAVHGDVAAADFLGEGLGEADHARLGSGVVGLSGVAHTANHRGDADDAPALMAKACWLVAMRLFSPASTLPGAHSTLWVMPCLPNSRTVSTQRTGEYLYLIHIRRCRRIERCRSR